MTDIAKDDAATFIARWKGAPASELSASQSFLSDLCRLLGVDVPHPTAEQDYLFERPITFHRPDGSTSPGRVDLYKRGHFVLESKKLDAGTRGGKGIDAALQMAHSQAENYIRALPASEGRPPFLIVVDVGHRLDLYAEFSRTGGSYTPFPDSRNHRIGIDDLARDDIRDRLRRIWLDPMSLDPSRESAKVTRDIAGRLAELAKSLEAAGHAPEAVAQFLMRCLFTMFAEDVNLLPEACFTDLLKEHAEDPDTAMRMVESLWADMDRGRFSAAIRKEVLRFNGKLFKQTDTLPLDKAQLALLISAAKADWRHVEPAIFGTLLERALNPTERHKLGAHYTPRAYVERLVLPTVIEPLRREWRDALAAALTLNAEKNGQAEAIRELLRFHHRLCNVRVLDPACGSGNFLYVTLELLKRLEGEVLTALDDMGYRQEGLALGGDRADGGKGETVDPHNLLGIELNPRAAAIAEVVLWIGYLQWHFRTRGNINPPVPVIRDFANIENRDAVLAWDRIEFVTDEHGIPITRWDGRTMKASPITGEPIPDDRARVPLERYVKPRKAEWPAADFVVGNPPFLGKGESMRSALGDGYLDALRSTWPAVPESADFVMYWWYKAALLTRAGAIERFGFITTNSIKQTFNRRVIEAALSASSDAANAPLSLAFAIPDHPWVDAADGAAVRIAMTVGERAGNAEGKRLEVIAEADGMDDEITVNLRERAGLIHADLSTGADVTKCTALRGNERLSSMGVMLAGSGFIVTSEEAEKLGLGTIPGLEERIREYRNGRDLTDSPRGVRVIDLHGLDESDVRDCYPRLFQRVIERVKPERDSNRRDRMRLRWWLFAESRPNLRSATRGLNRYIAAVETAKHKTFQFLAANVLPDHKLIAIAVSEPVVLAVLSSRVHVAWALASGGQMGIGNDPVYNKSRCFEPFPFPNLDSTEAPSDANATAAGPDPGMVAGGETLSARIGRIGEAIDAHRKRQQAAHPGLTLTGMYNVLEQLRRGVALNPKEKLIHEQGLVSVLASLHDELDTAVLDAYGWGDLAPALVGRPGGTLPYPEADEAQQQAEAELLTRLVALNVERAAEEARGLIRWLRPAFQNPAAARAAEPDPTQAEIALPGGSAGASADAREDSDAAGSTAVAPIKPQPWPKDPVEQVRAVAATLSASRVPLSVDDLAARYTSRGPWKSRLPQLLDMLVAVGRAAPAGDGRYVAHGGG